MCSGGPGSGMDTCNFEFHWSESDAQQQYRQVTQISCFFSVDSSCRAYVKAHGTLQLGDIQSLSAGDLKCYFLFHGAVVDDVVCKEKVIYDTVGKALKQTDDKECKSLSIPLFKCNDIGSNSASFIFRSVQENSMDLKTLKIVRVVSTTGRN